MSERNLGTKRRCTDCGAPFYDMQRTPITCPKCGAAYTPVELLKSVPRPARKSRISNAAPAPEVAAEPPPVKDDPPEADDTDSDAEEVEVDGVPTLDKEHDETDDAEELT